MISTQNILHTSEFSGRSGSKLVNFGLMLNCFGPVRWNIIGSVWGQGHKIYYFSVRSGSGQKITGQYGIGVPKTLPRRTLPGHISKCNFFQTCHGQFCCVLYSVRKCSSCWYWVSRKQFDQVNYLRIWGDQSLLYSKVTSDDWMPVLIEVLTHLWFTPLWTTGQKDTSFRFFFFFFIGGIPHLVTNWPIPPSDTCSYFWIRASFPPPLRPPPKWKENTILH